VALFGPRQAGKTTLALTLGKQLGPLRGSRVGERRAKLAEPELYLADHLGGWSSSTRSIERPAVPRAQGLIDRAKREGVGHGLYLLLGSASLELLEQSGRPWRGE